MTAKKPQNNPLLEKSPHKNDVPPLDKIKPEHFLPALDWAIAEAERELQEIKSVKNPDFDNVILAFEKSGETLSRVASVFFSFDGVMATEEIKELGEAVKTKYVQFESKKLLDADLFKQIKAVHDKKDTLFLSPDQELLLDDLYKGFVRNGALLDAEDKKTLSAIDEKLAQAGNTFGKNVLNATNAFEYYADESEMAGLPDWFKEGAAEDAKKKGQDGKYRLTLHAPSVIPVLDYAENRGLREKIWRAFSTRAKEPPFDNKPVVKQIVELRHKRAQLLGYDTHADYVLEERMAKTKDAVFDMLGNYKDSLKDAAKQEFEELKAFAKSKGGPEDLKPWDIGFYAEKMKQEQFDFDSEELRPYFQFEKVRQGAFDVASKMYDIRFEKNEDYPVYHEEVEAFDVIDNKTGDLIGTLYTDYFPRETKRGGAWENTYRSQGRNPDGSRKPPIVGNHGNFTKPSKDKPSLLSVDEVLTLFHEFGHGLHDLLSDVQYKSQAGTKVKWDFVELPSQLLENWAKDEEVLAMFAKHHEDKSDLPKELVKKMKDADNFRAASGFMRQLQLATLDMMWHTTDPSKIDDVEAFEREVCKDFYLMPPEGALTSTAFTHIFDGGYSAGYYSYKWAEILDADAFEAFKEKGLFDKETAKKFRDLISSGGSKDPGELYETFRGRAPDPDALLRREGLLKPENDNSRKTPAPRPPKHGAP
ncbi:MAG: M3 family peptidase [Micavibrio sp.]|nr:MAG: M3 family peptidase [Micavibrio sp.]